MTTRDERPTVLCVDDEPNVLEGLTLNLRRRYDVRTAPGGGTALNMLAADPTPAVIISDMRMPGMDGATFLSRARQIAPHATRILLTGQADTASAISAVNDGQIFRFLCKPCAPPVLLGAVEAGVEQHRLVTAERVLLEQTLQGSVKALTDVLALTSPAAFGRANRIRRSVSALAEALDLTERWQVEMAAMLSQLGSIILPPETLAKMHAGERLSEAEYAMVTRMPVVTEQLLTSIPRLETVRGILSTYYKSPAPVPPGKAPDAIRRGAAVLRAVVDFDGLEAQGHDGSDALGIMRSRQGRYDGDVLGALEAMLSGRGSQHDVREIPLSALRVGMVLAADVKSDAGLLLAARGYEVTSGFIERLANAAPRLGVGGKLLVVVPAAERVELTD